MKKLLVFFVALSVVLFTSCSKDDNDEVKPVIIGTWSLGTVIESNGQIDSNFPEVYFEFLEDNSFNEITLDNSGDNVSVDNYTNGYYAFNNNTLITTEYLLEGGTSNSTVKIIDNNTIELLSKNGLGEGYTFTLKRSNVNLAAYIEEYKNY